MKKTLLICGYGVGISDAVARRFGSEGFDVAVVARSEQRLMETAKTLRDSGVNAQAFTCDLGDPEAVQHMVDDVHRTLGPIQVVHYNAYCGGAGDLLTATPAEFRRIIDVSVIGLVVTTQAVLTDLKASKGAVLVTGGALAFYDPQVDTLATQWHSSGLAIGKAAQHKTVGLLRETLASEGIYVGEVVVASRVKGTAFDSGNATLEPARIAEQFWMMFQNRNVTSITLT
jgi:short-subunit dehydrogenase